MNKKSSKYGSSDKQRQNLAREQAAKQKRYLEEEKKYDDKPFAISFAHTQKGQSVEDYNKDAKFQNQILKKLAIWSKLCWRELRLKGKQNGYEVFDYNDGKIAQQPCKGIDQSWLQDTRIVCFRINDRSRIFGFIKDAIFFPLWIDKDHNIMSSNS